jgi:hypothetical protein
MSGPPPRNLQDWTKKALIREVQRLRAINREHAERVGQDPREQSAPGAIIDPVGDPHASGGVIVDARSAVLLEGMDVTLVDTMDADDGVLMVMTLSGRINYSPDRVEHAYMLGPDGAAAVVTELIGLAQRAGAGALEHGKRFAAEFKLEVQRRMDELP